MESSDWNAMVSACDVVEADLPIGSTTDEQLNFLRAYLTHARETGEYECYECVERMLTTLEAAEDSPLMDV